MDGHGRDCSAPLTAQAVRAGLPAGLCVGHGHPVRRRRLPRSSAADTPWPSDSTLGALVARGTGTPVSLNDPATRTQFVVENRALAAAAYAGAGRFGVEVFEPADQRP